MKQSGENGIATFKCSQSSTVSQYRMTVSGFHNSLPLLGHHASKFIDIKKNFYLQANVPLTLTTDDKLYLPVGFANASEDDYEEVKLMVQAQRQILAARWYCGYVYQICYRDPEILYESSEPLSLSYDSRSREHIPLTFPETGKYSLDITASAKLSSLDSDVLVDTKKFKCNVLRRVSRRYCLTEANILIGISKFHS